MRIYMQTPSGGGEPPKYYQLTLQQDLLGGWLLTREWGQPGTRTSLKREQYLDFDSAEEALQKAREAQRKKGFQVMFSQGSEGPARR
ncbi:MAG: WGR domain-containing protein [Xanthomonadales bacterium]|nr:WGR domain-containing protein [Xanthomonadales bacterium]MCB1626522.1 WGR domain-containing protein [Xanthomonadales bacterium]MCB1636890.1 WGR domain-containing protein [Xanthomonadales bacterium]